MRFSFKLPLVPASFFAIVLGLGGLGNGWRVAHRLWDVPVYIGESLLFAAAVVWLMLVVSYIGKWIWARDAALSETSNPVQRCFIGLIGVATTLMAGAALPYSRVTAEILFVLSVIYTLAFAVWRTGTLWQGGRDPAANTAVLYLPSVGSSFVTAAVAGALGYTDIGQMAFGAGFFSWLAIESVLLHRLYTAASLPVALRPTLGIQLAPPNVGAIAYLSVTNGPPDIMVHALLGYGILQALLMLRLMPWITQQPFAVTYWAFSFGATALGAAFLRLTERGDAGAIPMLAPYVFGAVNVIVLILVVRTVGLIARGQLLPMSVPTKA